MRHVILVVICFFMFTGSALALGVDQEDIYLTPKSPSSNFFGGYIGGASPGSIDWSIGNCVPPDGRRTKDIVFSTCDGDPAKPESWTERFRITNDGALVWSSPNGDKWIVSVDNFGSLTTTPK